MFRRWALALLFLPFLAASAQSGRLAVTGRVLSAAGTPLAGAEVSVAVGDNPGASFGRVDSTGSYRILVARGASSLLVTARMLGHAPQFRRVAVSAADSITRVSEMRLVAIAAALPAVRTIATRTLPPREDHFANYNTGDFSTTTELSSFVASDLTGDLTGDASLALGILPGVALTTDARSFSVAGLSGDQNRVAVNGVDFGGTLPRGAAAARVRLSGYDPAVSISGGLVDQRFFSGSFVFHRGAQITLDAPALQASSGVSSGVGQRVLHPVVSATMGGLGRGFINRYTISAQGSRRSGTVSTLASADGQTLAALRIDPDSVRRLVNALVPLGIVSDVSGTDQARSSTQGSVFARVDFSRAGVELGGTNPDGRSRYGGPSNNGASTYLVAGGSWSESKGAMLSPFVALPVFDAPSHASNGMLQLADSRAIRDVVLNEIRSTLTLSRSGSRPTVGIPSASVLLGSSATADGEASVASIQAAGTGSARSALSDWTWKTTNESQWATVDNRHTFKVVLEGSVQRAATVRDASLGTFTFNSLAEFVANRPASFTRALANTESEVSALVGAVGLGDKFRPTKNFGVQYGLRAERYTFGTSARRNSPLEAAFGVTSDALPNLVSLSPMAGFNWNLGPQNRQGYADPRTSLTGGIRDYRGAMSARMLEPFAGETGLAKAALRLTCIGAAVPVPDWGAYAAASAAVPEECVGGTTSPFAQTAMPVSIIDTHYALGHSWRAELQFNHLIATGTTVSLGGTMALNSSQPGWRDLNFRGDSQFLLANEGNRPVYVPETSIVPSSGAVSTTLSRKVPAYGTVMQRGSELRSRSASLTARLEYRPIVWGNDSRPLLPVSIAYVLSDASTQANGFAGTTADDPRVAQWEPGGFSRHVLQVSTFVRIPDWGTISLGVQARSGQSYTPVISGDVNGDGLSNDRAFVFDPNTATTEPAVAAAMRALLGSRTSSGACLRARVGAIAAARSCTGPWTATTNTSFTLDPRLTHLYNRGAVRLHVYNVLGGLDQLLHGAAGMRGWGQGAYPDPSLLRVRGFDASNRRFLYSVNPQFGSTLTYRNFFATPFRLALDVQVNLEPNKETAFVRKSLVSGHDRASPARDSAELSAALIGRRFPLFSTIQSEELLALSPAQHLALTELDRKYAVTRDSIYGALAGYVATRPAEADDAQVQRRFHDAAADVRRAAWSATQSMWRLLTPAQWELVANRTMMLPSLLFVRPDEKQLERDLKQWQWYAP